MSGLSAGRHLWEGGARVTGQVWRVKEGLVFGGGG